MSFDCFGSQDLANYELGPPRNFFTGHLRQICHSHPWKMYQQWSRKWGDVISLRIFGRDIVVLNGARIAEELLEKRSKIYCDRPTWAMADLIGRQDNVGFAYYGEKLRTARRLLRSVLGPQTRATWGAVLEEQTLTLLKQLLTPSQDWQYLLKRHVASVFVRFTYGSDATEEYVHLAEEIALHTGLALQPGWIVDSFPFCMRIPVTTFPSWLPGMGFKRWAMMAREKFLQCTREPYLATRSAVLNGTAAPSYVTDNLKAIFDGSNSVDESILMATAGSIYGGQYLTVAFLLSFFLLMTTHQDIQKKVQDEIMSVVGASRLPTLEDQPHLPYVEALIREIHRYNPVINLVSHSPLIDDDYEGYCIPRKAWVMCNVWSMTHDETLYSDVDTFYPERHLDFTATDPRRFTFGFGRRACPGVHFANAHTFLVIARVLALFRILPPINSDGTEQIPTVGFTSSFTS
ncbi:cytochrome P450 [Pisolithus albus]|nr:cytochrome P450 [Pisolithus albus]